MGYSSSPFSVIQGKKALPPQDTNFPYSILHSLLSLSCQIDLNRNSISSVISFSLIIFYYNIYMYKTACVHNFTHNEKGQQISEIEQIR